jgi:hypothetical protein
MDEGWNHEITVLGCLLAVYDGSFAWSGVVLDDWGLDISFGR